MTMRGTVAKYKARIPVPSATRRAIADLVASAGPLGAMQALGISRDTFNDACIPGGILRPEVLEKIEQKLGLRPQSAT